MTVEELISILNQYPLDMQVFVKSGNLHDPEVIEYEMPSIPDILVIS